jgi:hypothetical protein
VDIADHFGKTLVGYNEIAELFLDEFVVHHIRNVVENEIFVASENTLTYRMSEKFDIPCIELEINRKYRDPYRDKRKFIEMLNALCDIVLKINETYELK